MVQDNMLTFPGPESDLIESYWRVLDNFRELQSSDVTLQPLFKKICEADFFCGSTLIRWGLIHSNIQSFVPGRYRKSQIGCSQ